MIFRPELVSKILTGAKTQTRRIVKQDEDTCRYRKGRIYAVQRRRGGRAVTRVEVLKVKRERLHAITGDDARREGFETVDEFLAYWAELYGEKDDRDVWVITFTVIDQAALFLARPVPGRRGDYTHLKAQAIDDLPVVDPDDLVDDSDLRYMLLSKYVGWEPEDILADAPQFNTTDDIKRLRRALGQRGVDGLPQPTQAQLDRTLEYMVREGRSVRDVARAMDCSTGQAHKLIQRTIARGEAA